MRLETTTRWRQVPLDVILAVVVLVLANAPLLWGRVFGAFVFLPDRVLAGEWWRVLTHAWVHVSGYHLLLDAGSFLLLYPTVGQGRMTRRLGYLTATLSGALLAAALAAPATAAIGYCGLSGVAHGLLAVSALEWLMNRCPDTTRQRGLAALMLAIVIGKSLAEAITGQVVFVGWHPGNVGTPIAVAHAGGVLGGVVAVGLGSLGAVVRRHARFLAIVARMAEF